MPNDIRDPDAQREAAFRLRHELEQAAAGGQPRPGDEASDGAAGGPTPNLDPGPVTTAKGVSALEARDETKGVATPPATQSTRTARKRRRKLRAYREGRLVGRGRYDGKHHPWRKDWQAEERC